MEVTLTLRQVENLTAYLKRVDADTRPTLAALHFARMDEKHARAYVTDGVSAIVIGVDANWDDDPDQTLSYSRDDLKLIVATAKANKMWKDYNVTFSLDQAVFAGSDRLIIRPLNMTAPNIGALLETMRKPIERFTSADKSLDFVMLGGVIELMQKMLDLSSPLQFDVRFVGDVAVITHSKEKSVFALQMATFPDGNFGAIDADVYEQNVKRILGRE